MHFRSVWIPFRLLNPLQVFCSELSGEKNWKYVLKLWAQRNEDIHGTTLEQKEIKKKNSMIEELQEIQQNNQDMSMTARALVAIDSTRMKKMSNNNLEMFLYGARIVAKVNQINRQSKNLNAITNYFGSLVRPPEDPKGDRSELDPGEI
jgi:hypothetical protein